ncbi:hypothetical protein RintRC_3073 [Richelia intracellularis]|nr:hypothetical protein RintRC_3073 [Richelia intracellularis]
MTMLKLQNSNTSSLSQLVIGLGGIVIGLGVGFLTGVNPLMVSAMIFAVALLVSFFAKFEQAVVALLILRSSLDPLSSMQIPAAFAIGVDLLTLLYVTLKLLTGQPIKVDKFWWLFAGWVLLQGLWVILLPLGGLGLDGSYISAAIREWVRLFSWLMVYLIVMQLKDRVNPKKLISLLFLSLIVPLTAAAMQTFLPQSLLPPLLVNRTADSLSTNLSRINGTLGHPNTFGTFVLLFIGLTNWKLRQTKQRLTWFLLLGILAFFLVGTKALFIIVMLAIFILALIAPKLSLTNLIGGLLLFAIVIGLFAMTEFGQERLASITETPLLNPDMDISRAILLSKSDGNSFNWRLAEWFYLLKQWEHSPWLGFGLGTSPFVSHSKLLPHNDYIRALIEGGIIGIGTFIVFLGAQITRLIQLIRSKSISHSQRQLCEVILAISLALPVGMITENIWSHTTFFFYWSTLMAIAGWDTWDKSDGVDSSGSK